MKADCPAGEQRSRAWGFHLPDPPFALNCKSGEWRELRFRKRRLCLSLHSGQMPGNKTRAAGTFLPRAFPIDAGALSAGDAAVSKSRSRQSPQVHLPSSRAGSMTQVHPPWGT